MKAKVIATLLAIVVCAAFFGITHVRAASNWYTCTIERVGPTWDKIYVRVTDVSSTPAFTNKWCILDEIWQNQMLAVCLTAMTNDQRITIKIDPAIKDPTITQMLLNSY